MLKNIFTIMLFFTTSLLIFCQETKTEQPIDVSTTTVEPNDEIQPMYYKFYHLPEVSETPSLEYEDINIPYLQYANPEINKLNIDNKFFVPKNVNIKNMNLYFGNNSVFTLNIKNITSVSTLFFTTELNNNTVYYNNEKTIFSNYELQLCYNHVLNSTTLGILTKNIVNFLDKTSYQYELSFNIDKIFYNNMFVSYIPQFMFFKTNNIEKYFSKQYITYSMLLHDKIKFATGLSLYNIYTDVIKYCPIVKLNSKDFPVDKTSFLCSFSYSNDNKLYYSLEFKQGVENFYISFLLKNDLFYDYTHTFLVKFPVIKIDRTTRFYLPEVYEKQIGLEYILRNFTVNVSFTDKKFDKYPTYKMVDTETSVCFVDNIEITGINFVSKFYFGNVSVLFNTEHNISAETLFLPQNSMVFTFQHNLQKINYSVDLKYLSKYKINNEHYLDEQFLCEILINYKLRQNFGISLKSLIPINSKSYVQPMIYYTQPRFLVGVQLQF